MRSLNKNIFWLFLFLINIPYLLIHGTDRCHLQEFDRSIKAYETQASSDPEVVNTLYITYALVNKTQGFFNTNQDLFSDTLLTSCSDNVTTVINHLSNPTFNKKSLLHVIQTTLNNVCPVYTYLAIGSLSDLEETSQRSSLIATMKPLEQEFPRERFNEILAILIGIAQEYRSKSHDLKELMRFYCLTGLCDNGDANIQNIKDGQHSLLEHLQSKNIGSADNASDSFFSTAQKLIKFDKESEIQLIQSLLGDPYDSSMYYSVLGNINQIATLSIPTNTSTDNQTNNQTSLLFQRMLIGQNEFKQSHQNHTRSLFSNIFETRSITDALLQNMDVADIHHLIRHIGLWGDITPQSLFGSLAILKKRFSDPATNSFDNFDEDFGLSERLTSCCGHASSLRKEMLQHFNIPMDADTEKCLFYLSPDSIVKLTTLPPNTNKSTVKRLVLDDFIEHINGKKDQPLQEGSLIFQLDKLYQSTASFSTKSHIADRIGTQLKNGEITSFSFRHQLNRFIQDLLSSDTQNNDHPFAFMDQLNYSDLYQIFFGNINSIQARLYEINARQINDNQNYADIIGSILSQDQSMCGLINHVIKQFEIEPILSKIGSKELKLDENGSIVDQLYSMVHHIQTIQPIDDEIDPNDEKIKKEKETIEQLINSIGTSYTPYSLSNNSLINLMIYFRDIFNQSFSIIPREKIFKYAHYIYKSDETTPYNIADLVQKALVASKSNLEETFNICGIINDQIGSTIWVQTNTILNGLYDDILGLIESNHAEDENIEEDSTLSTLLLKLQTADPENTIDFIETKIKKLNNFIGLFQEQHFHLSLNALVQHIFGILPEYAQMTDFHVLNTYDTSDHALEPLGLLETIYNAFPDKKLIRYGAVNDLITEKTLCGYLNKMLYFMISKPLLDLLYRDSDAAENNNIFSLLKQLKAKTEKYSDLFDYQAYNNLNPLGSENEELTEENIDSVSIFALFNEIYRILSQTHLFMEKPAYTYIKTILQDCYDTEIDATKRSLFSNLQYILKKIANDDLYLENKEIIRDSIGIRTDNKATAWNTIYKSLNYMIDYIVSDYKYFIFKNNFPQGGIHLDSNLSILDYLNTMNHILDDPYYGNSIQNKNEVLSYFRSNSPAQKNLFQQIQNNLQTLDNPEFQDCFHQARPLHSFLLFSKLLQKSTQEFIQKSEYSTLSDQLEPWSDYIKNLISFGPCSGCHQLNDFINQAVSHLDEIIYNLKTFKSYPGVLDSILTTNSFADLNFLKDTRDWFQILSQDIQTQYQNNYKKFHCYFDENKTPDFTFEKLATHLEKLYKSIRNIWEKSKQAYITTPTNHNSSNQTPDLTQLSDCLLLQYSINQLGDKLNDLSINISIPNTEDISYNQENLVQLQLLEDFLSDFIQNETDELENQTDNTQRARHMLKIFRDYSTCAGCVVEQLDIQPIHNSLKHVIHRIGLLKKYIKDSIYTTFIKNIYQISLTTNQIAQSFNHNISSSLLIHTLNSGNLGATFQDLVMTFNELPDQVINIYNQYEQQGIASDDLYQFLEDCNVHLKKIYQSYLAINRCFYPQNYIIETIRSTTPKYTLDNLLIFLQSILSDASQINKTWKSLNIAASSLTSIQEDRFLIPALTELRASQQKIVTQLDLWSAKDPSNELDAVFCRFSKDLSSILSAENTFLVYLKNTFSNLCMSPCIKAMNQFTQTLFLFSEYLNLIPNTHLKDSDEFVSVLLPNFSNVLQSIAKVLTLSNDTTKDICLHFFLTQTFINLANVINNAVRSIRELSAIASQDSISTSVEDSSNVNIWGDDMDTQLICIANQFEKINNWFAFAAQNCQPVQLCNSVLFNHLNNLADTYDQLMIQANQFKDSIVGKKLCMYTSSSPVISTQQWMNISNSFDFQKRAVLKMVANLQAKLYCSKQIEQTLYSLSNAICEINRIIQTKISHKNIISLLQQNDSEKHLSHIQNIFTSIDDINNEIYKGVTFFEQHRNQIFCISETTDIVKNVYLATNYLKNELDQLLQRVESNPTTSAEVETDIIQNIGYIALKLANVASNNFDIPSNIYDTSASYSVQNIAQKIQKMSDYLLSLHDKLAYIAENQNENPLFKCHIDLNAINSFIKQMHQNIKEVALNLLTIQQYINWQIKLNIHSKRLENLQNSGATSNKDIFDKTKQELSKINRHINATSQVVFNTVPCDSSVSSMPVSFDP